MTNAPVRLVLVGWGAIGTTAAALLSDPGIEIVGIATRTVTERAGVPPGAHLFTDPKDLRALAPDVVAEAAGRDAVEPWGRAALDCGADLIVSSVSAFADAELLESMRHDATRAGRQVFIQPGALAGVDALAAARTFGIDTVEHRIVKPPVAWGGTPATTMCDLDNLEEPIAFYQATAAETAAAFPKNANVAMTTALAGIGPDATRVTLIADPAAVTNRHEVSASGAFGQLEVSISNNPLPANPKTSAMAALSLVRTIENRRAAIVV